MRPGPQPERSHYRASTQDEEAPEDLDESDRYLALPDKRSLDLGTHLAFAFAEQEMDDECDTVRQMFRRRGAYGRFIGPLDKNRLLETWYAFEERSVRDALRAWREENESEVIDKTSK